jgi:ABC-type glycerol-3-phosphate transport system permease component
VMSSVLIPFTVWTLVSFVQRVPSEMEEAAIVDGTNLLQRLWYCDEAFHCHHAGHQLHQRLE